MPTKINSKDAREIRESIQKLTAQLRRERKAISIFRQRIANHRRRVQKLEAWRRTRKAQLSRIRDRGPRRVVEQALLRVGQTESPAGSNKGPRIVSRCQDAILGYDGVAWCGCFVGYMLRVYGSIHTISSRIAYCPNIILDAKAGINGLKFCVKLTEGRAGDVACFDWNHDGIADHTCIIVENLGGGWYKTVEGNTSFDDSGSQSNGGCVALRKRHSSTMIAICRPRYS